MEWSTILFRLEKKLCKPKPHKNDLHFAWSVGQPVAKEPAMPLDLTITNEQKIPISVSPVTATGKSAQIDGAISITVVSGTGTIEMVDATNAFLVSGSDPGDTAYLVEADADLGSGVQTIQDTAVLHVTGALATSLGLTAGSAVPK